MFKYFSIALLFASQAAFASAQCFIVKDLKDNTVLQAEGNCDERFTPASTFKIPLSLMGFDSGIFTSATVPEWKYQESYDAWGPPCAVPINPTTWMKNSCVWYSQELTQKLGEEKFKHYIDAFNYGNKDITGDPGKNNGLTRSWLGSSLKISPEEQLTFISKLIHNQLPVSLKAQELTREILFAETLPGEWKLYGKTGTAFQKNADGTLNDKRQLGWYVGWVTKGNDTLVFAYFIKDEKDNKEYAGPRAKLESKQKLITLLETHSSFADAKQINQSSVQGKLRELETSADGRIGISVIDMENNQRVQYRADERFPMQSTFKVMVVAAVLKQSMTDEKILQKKISYTKQDIAIWSPITEKQVTDGMTISELCAAAIMYSDSTAANLLIKELGGAEKVTAFARSIDDGIYSLDSSKVELNSIPEGINYTTTPAAMEMSLQKLMLGNVLATPQREQLVNWMKANTTGDHRIRAGVPKGWIVADKTGSGDYGMTNDIGVIYPPKCKPIIAAIYFIQNKKDTKARSDVIASATRIVINEFAQTDQCLKKIN